MRRPFDVKAQFFFLFSVIVFPFSQAAPVAILPSALFCERYSLGARWVFSFHEVLLSDNRALVPLTVSVRGRAPGLSRSHLDSAVELGCSGSKLSKPLPALLSGYCAMFVHLSAYPQPMQQYRQLSSHGNHRSFLGIFPSSLRKL
jgi:hypothetical protein